jgi:[ribosomal protein S18]-alanine N-acetyltransferase
MIARSFNLSYLLPFNRKNDLFYENLKSTHSVDMARLHSQGFYLPWTDGSFYTFLNQPDNFGIIVRRVGENTPAIGFVLARVIADEAEILTIVVDQKQQGKGLGMGLMTVLLRKLHELDIKSLFLEVDEQNNAAIGLYKRLGFEIIAKRPSYYETAHGRSDALVMQLTNI